MAPEHPLDPDSRPPGTAPANSQMRWAAIRLNVDAIPGAALAAAELLLQAGSAGVADDFESGDRLVAVTGYLPADDRLPAALRRISAATALLPSLGIEGVASQPSITLLDEEDWANAWKRYFKPIRIGRSLIVSPPWESPNARAEDHILVIDPGMAFGTGTHPTTQLCLAAIEDYFVPESMIRVADIGTGSGILAIAAKKLGAAYVCACDVDPVAVRIARRNSQINDVIIDVRDEADWSRPYDLLVANILADTLIGLADRFAAALNPGGIYIASGIIEGREADVRASAETLGFIHLETREQGEWRALVFRTRSHDCATHDG